MAIKSLKDKKRQQMLLFVGLGMLIIAVLILYFGFWKDKGEVSEEMFLEDDLPGQEISMSEKSSLALEEQLKKIDLDFSFLIETILPFLKSHGDLPVVKGETGRSNPFSPY